MHLILKQLSLKDLLWSNDGNGLYPCAMWDEKSIYLRNETGYVFTTGMNKELVKKFNNFNIQ